MKSITKKLAEKKVSWRHIALILQNSEWDEKELMAFGKNNDKKMYPLFPERARKLQCLLG